MSARYSVEYTPHAARQIRKLNATAQARILRTVGILAETPRPPAATRLVGGSAWRVRTGDFRIIYEIRDDVLLVTVIEVGHRRNVYRR